MKIIHSDQIIQTVKELCISACMQLPEDVTQTMRQAAETEPFAPAQSILQQLRENAQTAEQRQIPICQDTGMACVFLELGQDVHIDWNIEEAVNNGVRRGYGDGYLRKSVVCDPLRRVNTGDNTPALLSVKLVPGESLRITVMPKGFGSENMSALKMLKPADGVEGVKRFILETVEKAGANPCPPIIVGVGIGGSFDKAAYLAKHALLRPLDEPNHDEYYAALEKEMCDAVNALGIGPQGFGGKTTCLAVNIETYPTHIAGLPCAVNIGCHVTRHASAEI